MGNVPEELRYSEDHEWLRYDDAEGIATVGITDYAQGELGDVVYLDLPAVGRAFSRKESLGTIEAVKTVADIYAPLAGEIVAVNGTLEDRPEQVNQDPYGDGWMLRLRVADRAELDRLMDAAAYREHVG